MDIRTPAKTAFAMSFLYQLLKQSELSASDSFFKSEAHPSILRAAISGFTLRQWKEERPQPSYYGYGRVQGVYNPVLDGHALAFIAQHCIKLGLDDILNGLISKVLQEISNMDTRDFPKVILPLLRSLLANLERGEVQAQSRRHLFQSSPVQYIVRHVGEEPRQASWAREPVECKDRNRLGFCALSMNSNKFQEPCDDCQQLNVFLQDPKEKVWRFSAEEDRRKHLINEVSDCECFTTVEKDKKPFTLVLVKHKNSMNEKHRRWASRVAEVKSHLLDLEGRHPVLDNVLAEKYGDIMAVHVKKLMQELERTTGGSERQASHLQKIFRVPEVPVDRRERQLRST